MKACLIILALFAPMLSIAQDWEAGVDITPTVNFVSIFSDKDVITESGFGPGPGFWAGPHVSYYFGDKYYAKVQTYFDYRTVTDKGEVKETDELGNVISSVSDLTQSNLFLGPSIMLMTSQMDQKIHAGVGFRMNYRLSSTTDFDGFQGLETLDNNHYSDWNYSVMAEVGYRMDRWQFSLKGDFATSNRLKDTRLNYNEFEQSVGLGVSYLFLSSWLSE